MTQDDVWLQSVIDRSIEGAGPYLRMSFQMPQHSLSARQLITHLKGFVNIALATVTKAGEPRVAPIGAVFHRGRFCAPILTHAARAKHVKRNPAVSLTYYEGNDLAVIVHGTGRLAGVNDPEFGALEQLQQHGEGQSVRTWGPEDAAAFLIVEPGQLYTFARRPEEYPEDA